MKIPRLYSSSLVAVAVVITLFTGVRADDTTNTIKFSDPSKPGTVKITLGHGQLRVQGADTNEVSIKTESQAITSKPRKDGLRVISAASSFALTEKDNVVTLDSAPHDWGRGNGDFRITVPRSTSIIVKSTFGGDISCSNLNGDIEINSMHGEIRLEDVGGGVIVSTMQGEIRANIRELREGKPLNFTSMNGEVVLRVPETSKANVRLRTQNGSVLTDFDETALVTKTEAMAGVPRGRNAFVYKGPSGKVLSAEIQDAIREATQVSATAVKEALEAVKEGFEAARLNADDARRQMDEARKELERAKRDADRERRDGERERKVATTRSGREATPAPAAAPVVAGTPPTPPAMPGGPSKMSIPTISGGKLVTGTLNGGGPEISVSTMNGDVTLRKLETKK